MPLYVTMPEEQFTALFRMCRNTVSRAVQDAKLREICSKDGNLGLEPDGRKPEDDAINDATLRYFSRLALGVFEFELDRLEKSLREPKRGSLLPWGR